MKIRLDRLFRVLWGSEEEGEGEDGGDGGDPPEPPNEPEPRTLTAKELEAITARSADRASRKATKDLAKEFGFESVADLKAWAEAQRKAEKDAMDDKDRALAEAAEATRAAEALRSSLASDRLDTEIIRAVLAEGVTDKKKQNRIAVLVRTDLDSDLVNDEDAWEEAITEALSSVKEDTPELFAAAKAGGHGSGDGGARGGSAPKPDDEAAAQKKLQDEFEKRGLVSYPTT